MTDAIFTGTDLRGINLNNTDKRGTVGLPKIFDDDEN
jgi:hypothetical protein